MRSFHTLAFDDVVEGTSAVYSAPSLDSTLGSVESLSICAVASQAGGTSPTLTVQVEQGPDERRWENRNTTAEIDGVSLSKTAENVETANDGDPAGATRLAFVRLRIQLGGTNPQARLKIWVTGRGEQIQQHIAAAPG